MSLDLEAIANEFINQCGSCDVGMPTACTCSKQDFRPVMLKLIRELERTRKALDEAIADFQDLSTTARIADDPSWRASKAAVITLRAIRSGAPS